MLSRIQVLTSQPKLALGALLTLLLAAGAVVGSGADFTATSANPANTFASGTLTIGNSKQGTAVLTAGDLRPGGPAATGEVDIKNDGSLSGAFTLSRTAPADSDAANPLSGKLNVTVIDCGDFSSGTPTCGDGDDAIKYTGGTLAEMGTPGHLVSGLGTFAAGEQHRYQFTVQLDGSAGDEYQGDGTQVEFDFNATQA
jgi:spore coat-associated protein N